MYTKYFHKQSKLTGTIAILLYILLKELYQNVYVLPICNSHSVLIYFLKFLITLVGLINKQIK